MKSNSGRVLLAVATSAVLLGGGTAAAAAKPQPAVNKPPVASFTDSVSWLTVSFTDTSTDPDGTIASHAWNFGDGSTSTAADPVHIYAAAATYNVTETVKDNKGASSSRKVAVTALANPDKPPVANFTYSSKFVSKQGWVATFTDASTDSDGTIAAHAWNFGDGATSTAANPVHTFVPGNYNVVETVTDNGGATASKTRLLSFSTVEPVFELGNTGFETTGSWTASTGVLCTTGCSGESAHAGVGFAWMGGYGAVHTDTLSQSTPGPILQGSSIPLQFYLHIDTAETSTTTAYDKLTVALYGSGGNLLKTLATFSNLNRNTGYTVHSYDMRPYIGQQVTVRFTATEDSSQQTSFVLDDVTMVDSY